MPTMFDAPRPQGMFSPAASRGMFSPAYAAPLYDEVVARQVADQPGFREKLNDWWQNTTFFKPAFDELVGAATLPGDVYSGEQQLYAPDPMTGEVHTDPGLVDRSFALAGSIGAGGLAGVAERGPAVGAGVVRRTPMFDRWFSESKIVDPDGQPLVVYHGTKSDFDQFDIEKSGASDEGLAGKGFYFTYNPEEASGYALNEQFGKGSAPNVTPAYVSLKNPFVVTQGVLPDGRRIQELHQGGINSRGGNAVRKLAEDAGSDGIVFTNSEGQIRHVVAFQPEQIKSAIGNKGTFDPSDPDILAAGGKGAAGTELGIQALDALGPPPQPRGIRAYHGSPHDFDKFSMENIGTGEGAQAYGHGLYFAENEGVARNYREALAMRNTAAGAKVDWNDPGSAAAAWVKIYGDKDKALKHLRSIKPSDGADNYRTSQEAAAMLERGDELPEFHPGSMYEVDIAANPEDFLDWDKPLSEQPKAVRDLLEPTFQQAHDAEVIAGYSRDPSKVSGGDAYNAAVSLEPSAGGGPRTDIHAVTERLRAAKVPGIRYLDQGSRKAGEGSSNFVVFDDAIINILRKYGFPMAPLAGGGAVVGAMQPSESQAAPPMPSGGGW